MHKPTRAIVWIALVIVIAASLAACSPAGKPAPTPTSAQVLVLPGINAGQATQPAGQTQNQPAQPNPTAYAPPAVEQAQPTQQAGGDYPAPQGGGQPQAVQARENRSKITAQLLDAVPAPNEAGRLPLHIKVLSSEEVQGMPSFTQQVVNTEITLEVDPAGLPELKPGDNFTAMVSYQGDEKGGKYFGSEVTKP